MGSEEGLSYWVVLGAYPCKWYGWIRPDRAIGRGIFWVAPALGKIMFNICPSVESVVDKRF